MFTSLRWIADASARSPANMYAPSTTRNGCQPPKITIASAIQPSPAMTGGVVQPGLIASEYDAPAIPTSAPPMPVYT